MHELQIGSLFIGILPLLAFVIVDSFLGLKHALIATAVLALLEVLFTIYYFGEVDFISGLSLVLVFFFCYLSFRKKSDFFIKMQPVLLSLLIGLILITSYFLNRPFLLEFSLKYKALLPSNFAVMLENPHFKKLLSLSTLTLGFSHFLHAGGVYWSAIKLNNWWWIIMRGVGYYLFMLLGLLSARIFI